jgi:hypothetical protein
MKAFTSSIEEYVINKWTCHIVEIESEWLKERIVTLNAVLEKISPW